MRLNNLLTTLVCILLLSQIVLSQQPNKTQKIQYCGSIMKQEFLIKASSYQNNQNIEKSIEYMFPADRNKLMQGIIENNFSKIQQSYRGSEAMYGVNFGVILLFFALHLILVPILACTRCCSSCCKKRKTQAYSICQMYWPCTCLVFLIIASIVLCAIMLKLNMSFQPQYNDFKCSLGITTSDMLDGTSYNNNTIKFMGLRKYRSYFDNFLQNIKNHNRTIQRNLISSSRPISLSTQHLNILYKLNAKIPNDDASPLQLSYQNPLLSLNAVSYQNSTFNQILGTYNSTNSLVANMSKSIQITNASLFQIAAFADSFNDTANSLNTSQAYKEVSEAVQTVQDIEFNIAATIGVVENGIMKIYKIGSYVILGCSIFLMVLLFFAMACMVCYSEYPCRSKILCCCFFIWLIGILHFVIAIGFTLANPAVLYGCQYIKQGFSSEQAFSNNFGNISKGSKISDTISKCLANSNQSDYLYNTIYDENIRQNLTQLIQSYPNLSHSPLDIGQHINSNYTNLLTTIQNYRTARVLDISKPSMIEEIKTMANTEPCMQDSWLPSLKQLPTDFVKCTLNSNNTDSQQKADNSTCTSKQLFEGRAAGCVGCMDMYLTLQLYDKYSDTLAAMTKRYQQCVDTGRGALATNLTNLWYNYHMPKKRTLSSLKQKVSQQFYNINQLNRQLNSSINPSYNEIGAWLQSDPILDASANSTIAQQMDCRVLGMGITNSANILCSTAIPYVYNLRFIYSAIAVIMFLICLFTICLTSRAYHQKRVDRGEQRELYEPNKRHFELRHLPETERRHTAQELQFNAQPNAHYNLQQIPQIYSKIYVQPYFTH